MAVWDRCCWLGWSLLWFPWPQHGSILPLKRTFPLKHHWGKHFHPCYEEKLKGITLSRVNLDSVTQPLKQGAKTAASPTLRLEPYHWPIESCAGLEISCKQHTHFMLGRIYYPPFSFLFACFYQVSLNAKLDFQHGCVRTTASNWLSRFWKATAPDIHKTSEFHFWTNIWILLPSVDISCFPFFSSSPPPSFKEHTASELAAVPRRARLHSSPLCPRTEQRLYYKNPVFWGWAWMDKKQPWLVYPEQ